MSTPLPVKLLGTTLAAAILASCLVIPAVGGVMPVNFQAADIIKERYPLHIYPVDWVKGTDQHAILKTWISDEIKTRLALLALVWLVCMLFILWRHYAAEKKAAPESPALP